MNKTWEILIINQHGENRGDEAAQRGMLQGISDLIGKVNFVMVCQYRDRDLKTDFDQNVTMLPMLIPPLEFIGAFLHILLRHLGINLNFLLKGTAKKIVAAYQKADFVISAPGGPYLGDIYSGFLASHELAHWYMIYTGLFFKKPVFLYAPSAGPFKKKWINFIRRKLFQRLICLTTREEISKTYLEKLLPGKKIILTADSAIQRHVPPISRKAYFAERYKDMKDAFIVSISVNDYKYPLSKNPDDNKRNYEDCIINTIKHLHNTQKKCHFLMYPQLYGAFHSDVPYLNKIGDSLPSDISWEIIAPDLNSDQQQAIFGLSDLCVASRYHPQIFSALQSVPLIAICYEHKQFGFMNSLGLSEYMFDIYHLETKTILSAIDSLIEQKEMISTEIKKNIRHLIEKSRLTSELAGGCILGNKEPQ